MRTFLDEVEEAFAERGALALHLKGFQPRWQQLEMARLTAKVLDSGGIAVIEAGTGVGKSFAYVVPVLLKMALESSQGSSTGGRAVIATNKKPLQDQLARDIPKLLKALRIDARAVVLKGRNNYLSLRRLKNALRSEETSLFDPEGTRRQALERIVQWAQHSSTGEQAELIRSLDADETLSREQRAAVLEAWQRVQSDTYDCMRKACPHFEKCFFFRAKKAAEEAQIIITNQALLAMELLLRRQLPEESEVGALPSFNYLVIDEAHTLVESFTAAFSSEVSASSLKRLVERLTPADSQRRWSGLIAEFSSALLQGDLGLVTLLKELRGPLSDRLRYLAKLWQECFASLQNAFETQRQRKPSDDKRSREICYPDEGKQLYRAEDNPDFAGFLELISKDTLGAIRETVREARHFAMRGTGDAHDLATRFAATLQGVLECLETLRHFADTADKKWCRWYTLGQGQNSELKLSIAPIDVSRFIRELLTDEHLASAILTSATLAIGRDDFRPILKEWGLSPDSVQTMVCDSPFDYERNCLFAVPLEPHYETAQAEDFLPFLIEALDVTRGRAFFLFTSWDELNKFWERLENPLKELGLRPLKQSQNEPAQIVLDRFRVGKNPVLFGTMSFWEGVDIPGDQLSCVIVHKMPFPVVETPLIEARAKARRLGASKFEQILLPIMVTKLRQGFGRLIRTENDRGVVILLDNRLLRKSYHNIVLKSLPPARQVFAPAHRIIAELRTFFRQIA